MSATCLVAEVEGEPPELCAVGLAGVLAGVVEVLLLLPHPAITPPARTAAMTGRKLALFTCSPEGRGSGHPQGRMKSPFLPGELGVQAATDSSAVWVSHSPRSPTVWRERFSA